MAALFGIFCHKWVKNGSYGGTFLGGEAVFFDEVVLWFLGDEEHLGGIVEGGGEEVMGAAVGHFELLFQGFG